MKRTHTKPLDAESTAAELAARIAWGRPQPELTAGIARCRCPEPVRAGLYLLNGDWTPAHEVAQALETPLGAHWHALVHRHEPDFPNSRYWLQQAGASPIYPALAAAAEREGQAAAVATQGAWNPGRFTDCFADPAAPAWTRRLDELEMRTLLAHCKAADARR